MIGNMQAAMRLVVANPPPAGPRGAGTAGHRPGPKGCQAPASNNAGPPDGNPGKRRGRTAGMARPGELEYTREHLVDVQYTPW
jgi:hypothetical protein